MFRPIPGTEVRRLMGDQMRAPALRVGGNDTTEFTVHCLEQGRLLRQMSSIGSRRCHAKGCAQLSGRQLDRLQVKFSGAIA